MEENLSLDYENNNSYDIDDIKSLTNDNLGDNLSEDNLPEYDESRKCPVCGKPFILNKLLPEEVFSSLGKDFVNKIRYMPSCDCYNKLYEEDLKKRAREDDRISLINRGAKYKSISVIDEKFLKSTFEKADETRNNKICKIYAKAFFKKDKEKNGVGMLLYGDSGTGKTFDSACIANYLMARGKSVMALSMGLYFSRLKKEWSDIEVEILRKTKDCDLLIIDDFGAEKISDWVLEKIFLLIDTRYKAEKPMIISTNLENSEILKLYGKRIAERIAEMCYPLCYDGDSKRVGVKEKFKDFVN